MTMAVNGIAGGISGGGRQLGDVVVSSSVVYYELAKIRSNEQERRSRQFQADPSLLDGVLNLTSSDWKTRLPPIPDGRPTDRTRPRIHIGPIASGEKVVAAIDAVHRLRALQKDLIAIEMVSGLKAAANNAFLHPYFAGFELVIGGETGYFGTGSGATG